MSSAVKEEQMEAKAQRTAPAYRFARRMSLIDVSAVREILKVTESPDIDISFAGGMPAPELFPIEAMARAQAAVYAENGPAAMQYSTTEGWTPLRNWIANRQRQIGIDSDTSRVLIISGSQQGIDLVAKVFLDRGDFVVVDNPSYLAALQTFGAYEANFIPIDSDESGMRVDLLERALAGPTLPKLIYTNSEFQNPTGTSLSSERRDQLVELAARYGVPILEDNPYIELRYSGPYSAPLAARDKTGQVIYLSTFSKTVSPGIRIGWIAASAEIIKVLVTAKQSSDLHTSTVLQHALARMLEDFDYDGHINHLRSVYRTRRDAMLDALKAHFPEGARWTTPQGGLFIWVELPESMDGEELFVRAVKARVAFVPGAPFFAHAPRHNCIRLNFSNQSPEMIGEGIARLGKILKSGEVGI
ncbi:MAG TPA: PLP-dependent aminotransferase family protein [Blastocatellia bacterium]